MYFVDDYNFVDNEGNADESNELNLDTIVYYNDSTSANRTRDCPLTSSNLQLSQPAIKQVASESDSAIILRQYPQIRRGASLGFTTFDYFGILGTCLSFFSFIYTIIRS